MRYSPLATSLGLFGAPVHHAARALLQPSASRTAYASASSSRDKPPDSSNDEIDGVLKTRDENAKEFSRFISSVNVVTCNPWYPCEKGFTKLWIQARDGSRVEAKGKYDDPRVHLMDYDNLPDGIRNRLDVVDKLEWMCHALSEYLLKVFFDAFELGRIWGCIMLERQIKPNTGYFYAHGYGLPPSFLA